MNAPFKDRRKNVRIYRNFMLSCRMQGSSDVSYEMCQVHNIGRGGVSFSSTTSFPKGSTISIELKTPFLNDKIDLGGVVVECREKIRNLIYSVHVQFGKISTQALDVLAKIEQYSAQQG